MRFRQLDLNLLVALEALLDECSVTGAARRLNLSQAAMSNALGRLRDTFHDELLVRVGRQMARTDRGRILHHEVSDILRQIDGRLLAPDAFDPTAQARQMRIMASEALSLGFLATLGRRVHARAPKMMLTVEPLGNDPQARLDRGETELLALPRQYAAPDHPTTVLYDEPFAVICWSEAAIAREPLTAERYIAADHVLLELGLERKPPIDRILIEQSVGPLSGSITVTGHSSVPWHVLGTERLGTLPLRTAQQFADMLPLKVQPLPFDVPETRMVLQWGKHSEQDAALQWLVEQILELAQDPEADHYGPSIHRTD